MDNNLQIRIIDKLYEFPDLSEIPQKQKQTIQKLKVLLDNTNEINYNINAIVRTLLTLLSYDIEHETNKKTEDNEQAFSGFLESSIRSYNKEVLERLISSLEKNINDIQKKVSKI